MKGPDALKATLEDGLLETMTQAALRGGAIALDYFRPGERTSARIDSKEGGSPVTEADHAVDAFLTKELRSALPQAGWLSEETIDDPERLTRDLVFIVDPIDGTRAFMSGDARWAVCVALVAQGKPVAGVIHLPALEQTFIAHLGGGAFLNDRPIAVSNRPSLAGGLIAGPAQMLRDLAGGGMAFRAEPRIPSLALRFARVAEGSLDAGMASTNACDWDIAAADIILQEAGGRLIDPQGVQPLYNRPATRHGLLGAAPGQLKGELTAILRRSLERKQG
jgi:myo-inositol-1(or 4)-monophosphatase